MIRPRRATNRFNLLAVTWLLATLATTSLASTATGLLEQAVVPSQRELNGFLLGQQREILKKTFGNPLEERKTPDGWVYLAYVLDRTRNAYMVFKFTDTDPDHIFSIQVAGDPGTDMYPFVGLRLGDYMDEVLKVFGKPSSVEHNEEVDVDLYKWEARNYSLEVDRNGRLSSIQIFGYEGFAPEPLPMPVSIEPVKDAVLSGDIERLLSVVSAEIEIYRGTNVFYFKTAARKDLSDPTSAVYGRLCGKSNSLRAVFDKEHAEAEPELRLYEKRRPAPVLKFYASKIISEIVFSFEAGNWRIWEIKFR